MSNEYPRGTRGNKKNMNRIACNDGRINGMHLRRGDEHITSFLGLMIGGIANTGR